MGFRDSNSITGPSHRTTLLIGSPVTSLAGLTWPQPAVRSNHRSPAAPPGSDPPPAGRPPSPAPRPEIRRRRRRGRLRRPAGGRSGRPPQRTAPRCVRRGLNCSGAGQSRPAPWGSAAARGVAPRVCRQHTGSAVSGSHRSAMG